MSLDTGAGPGVASHRSLVDTAACDAADPYLGASREPRTPVPVPPAALSPTGPIAPRPRVTAVLVCRDGEPRLARTLAAVAAQTRPPELLVAADTGSADRSTAMLSTATPHILRLTGRATFGDAVQSVLAALNARARVAADPRPAADLPVAAVRAAARAAVAQGPAAREGEGRGRRTTEWLWLLHDDCAPAPQALERLLEAVETAPSVAVAGCKQVDWDDDQHLLDVGFTTSPLGARVTGLDPREVDQGQHDARSDVLAVSTAGMLVRRDVWEALGGPDPNLAHARDDIDVCRRVRLAGHRVVVVPAAVVAHAGAGPSGGLLVRRSWYRADRRDALHLRLADAHAAAVPLLLLWTAFAAPWRSLWRLVLKQPHRAVDELAAAALVLAAPRCWLRSRLRGRRQQAVPRRTLDPLLAGRRTAMRHHRDALAAWAAVALSIDATPNARAVRKAEARAAARAAYATRTAQRRGRRPAGPGVGSTDAGTDAGTDVGAAADPPSGVARFDVAPSRVRATVGVTDDRVAAVARGSWEADAAGAGAPPVAALEPPVVVLEPPVAALEPPVVVLEPPAVGAEPPVRALEATAVDAEPPAVDAEPPAAVAGTRAVHHGIAGLLAVVVAAGAAVAAALRDVLPGSGVLASPTLLPPPERVADLWALARSGWRPQGLGAPGLPDAFDTVLAGLGVLAGDSPGTAVAGLLVLGLPLSAVTGWIAAGALTRSRGVRAWAAAVWAAAPALLGAVSAGRPASALAHVLLPLLALALGRAVTRRSVTAASVAGLLLTAVVAAAPSLAVPAAVALAVLAVTTGRRATILAQTAAVPALLLLPWWVAAVDVPRLLLADPGRASAPARGAGAALWHLLLVPRTPTDLLGPLAPVVAATGTDAARVALVATGLLAAPVALAAVVGLLRRRWAVAAHAWVAGIAGLAAGMAAERVEVAGTPTGATTGWAGPGLSLLTLGLLVAAVVGADGVLTAARRTVPRRLARLPAPVAAVVAGVAFVGPLAVAGGWAVGPAGTDPAAGATGSATRAGLTRTSPDVLPALAAEEAQGAAALRTLVLDVRGQKVLWSLLATAGPRQGVDSASLAASRVAGPGGSLGTDSDAALVVPVVGALLSDSGRDVRPLLTDLGVGSVLALGPVDDATVLALDASPGLARAATSSRRDQLWRVQLDTAGGPSRPSRARVTDATGATITALPSSGAHVDVAIAPGAAGRLVVLAERRAAGWAATLDGRRLEPRTHRGWAQAFVLPATGGRLVVRYDDGLLRRTEGGRLAVLVLAALVALPLPRLRRRVAVAPARASRPVPRGVVTPPTPVAPAPQVFDAEHPEAAPAGVVDDSIWPVTEAPGRLRLGGVRRRGVRRDDHPTTARSVDEPPEEVR